MSRTDKPLVWLRTEIKTPPLSAEARLEAGFLLRRLQQGESLSLPHSRPMPGLGKRCHELRISDHGVAWRIIYRIDPDAIVILDLFQKKTAQTNSQALERSRKRLREYDLID